MRERERESILVLDFYFIYLFIFFFEERENNCFETKVCYFFLSFDFFAHPLTSRLLYVLCFLFQKANHMYSSLTGFPLDGLAVGLLADDI